jgi:peptidyl-prolyl cis-trans isomerase A (cyclophilin A)
MRLTLTLAALALLGAATPSGQAPQTNPQVPPGQAAGAKPAAVPAAAAAKPAAVPAAAAAKPAAVPAPAPSDALVPVVIETAMGEIEIVVDTKRAPSTAANFLAYVDAGLYDGGSFHRTVTPANQPNDAVRIEVIQADIPGTKEGELRPPIPLERTSVTGLRHTNGAVSMARSGPDTAQSSFFICIGDQPSLDFGGKRNPDGQGFAAFGLVTRGMDVVRRIQASPAKAQTLSPPIAIVKVRRR